LGRSKVASKNEPGVQRKKKRRHETIFVEGAKWSKVGEENPGSTEPQFGRIYTGGRIRKLVFKKKEPKSEGEHDEKKTNLIERRSSGGDLK